MGLLWQAQQNWETKTEYYEESFLFIGQRFSLLKITPAAVLLNSRKEGLMEILSRLLDVLGVGFALECEIIYWKEDLEKQYPTWLNRKLLNSFTGKASVIEWKPVNQVLQCDDFLSHLIEARELCKQYYEKALLMAEECEMEKLTEYIAGCTHRVTEQNKQLSEIW
jgi:hypothetical protein